MSNLSYWPSPSDITVTRRRRRIVRVPAPSHGPRKPLHLDGRTQPIDVRAAGPALAIARGARKLTLPVARIARILVCGRVHWDSAALGLCLQQRIAIIFLDAHARPTGAALPLVARTGALDELLCGFVDQPDWRHCYDNWLRSQRMRVLAQWRRDRARIGRPVDRAEWGEQVRAFAYLADPDYAGPCAGGCYALVLAVLLRAGACSQYRAADGGTLPLARDLGRVLDRRVALQLGTMTAAFEGLDSLKAQGAAAAAAEHEAFVVGLIERLRRCAADWIEPWP